MRAGDAIPTRALGLLIAIVLIAHFALLKGVSGTFSVDEGPAARPFATRLLSVPPPVAPIPSPAPARRQAAPVTPMPVQAPQTPADASPAPSAASSISNEALTPASRAQPAINSIASEAPATTPSPAPAEPAPAAPPEAALRPATTRVPGAAHLLYSVEGEARKLPYSARGELRWAPQGSHYEARLEVSAFLMGSRVQTSSGDIGAQGLAPTRFADKSRSELAAHFERDKGQITFSANTPAAPLLAGAQDRLSVYLQLGALLAGEPGRYPAGSTLSLQTVGSREAEVWQFTVGPEDPLALPGGTLGATRLTRLPRREYDQKVEIWLAPTMGWLPVRMKVTQANGDFADLLWRSSEAP